MSVDLSKVSVTQLQDELDRRRLQYQPSARTRPAAPKQFASKAAWASAKAADFARQYDQCPADDTARRDYLKGECDRFEKIAAHYRRKGE